MESYRSLHVLGGSSVFCVLKVAEMEEKTEIPVKLSREYQLHKRLQRLMGDALKEFAMIDKGDSVLLGLSGGKDSLALLDLLGERMKRSNGYFSLHALHVRMRNIHYLTDIDYLATKSAEWGIPFHTIEAGFEPDREENRTPCFLCSWNRRKTLFAEAQRLGCTKIALGHHQDDILRTALMNLTFNGSFSTMPAKIVMRKFPISIIRPLAKIMESDLKEWAEINRYRPVLKTCPYNEASNRTSIGSVTEELAKINGEYRQSLWHALLKTGALVETP